MKLCIPVTEMNGVNSAMSAHFGSAPVFMVYDTESAALSLVSNKISEHEHGQCMPVPAMITAGVQVVLCGGMGARAAMLLAGSGIKAFRVAALTAGEAIEQYKKGTIEEITASNACMNHSCH